MKAGSVSAGRFAPPILGKPRSSPQKFNSGRVVASAPSITGSRPAASGTPRTTIGRSAVPRAQITHLAR